MAGVGDATGGVPGVPRSRRDLLKKAATGAALSAAAGLAAGPAGVETVSLAPKPAAAQGGLVTAAEVSFAPAGDLPENNVQSALEAIDTRVARGAWLDDLHTAVEVREDFFGINSRSGQLGQYGWQVALGGAGANVVGSLSSVAYGYRVLQTGTTATGFATINLGLVVLFGVPIFKAEWRAGFAALSTPSDQFVSWIGLHDSVEGQDPIDGCYFKYDGAVSSNWLCGCANSGGRTEIDSGVPVAVDLSRLRIVCTGTAVHFYINGSEISAGPVTTNLPDKADYYGPAATIAKRTGAGDRVLLVDYFGGRFDR